MGLIVGLVNLKGGVGKSTLAINLAATWAHAGDRVLLVDCDPQGSALDWAAARLGPPLFSVLGLPRPTVRKELPLISKGYDRVVLDAPAREGSINRAVIMASDVILIPVLPSPYDVRALEEMVTMVHEALGFKDTLKVGFVVNRVIGNSAIGRDIYAGLAEYGFEVLKTQFGQRVIYAEAAVAGQAIWEMPSTLARHMASAETEDLACEVGRFANA